MSLLEAGCNPCYRNLCFLPDLTSHFCVNRSSAPLTSPSSGAPSLPSSFLPLSWFKVEREEAGKPREEESGLLEHPAGSLPSRRICLTQRRFHVRLEQVKCLWLKYVHKQRGRGFAFDLKAYFVGLVLRLPLQSPVLAPLLALHRLTLAAGLAYGSCLGLSLTERIAPDASGSASTLGLV